jgi:hypothetical protein
MSKLEKMVSVLNMQVEGKYKDGDLWQKMCKVLKNSLLVMDIDLSYNARREYGIDYRGKQRMCGLFFTGDSSYYPGIWIGEDDEELLDSMPIYVIDIECGDGIYEPYGNFREYIEELLSDFFKIYKKKDEYYHTALLIKEKIKDFSTETINKGPYKLLSYEYVYKNGKEYEIGEECEISEISENDEDCEEGE